MQPPHWLTPCTKRNYSQPCRADQDQNNLLSVDELAEWINTKIQEHISEALKENFGIFATIDQSPRNGK